VHVRPQDERSEPLELKPDVAPIPTPAVTRPAGIRKPRRENLLGPGTLVSYDSEYDGDAHAARNLVEPGAAEGWCSRPGPRPPIRFVFDLTRSLDVARVAFDPVANEEPGFEGSSAREVSILGSTGGSDGPWRELQDAT